MTKVESVLINEANLFVLLKTEKPLAGWVIFGKSRTLTAGDRLYSVDLHNYAGQSVLLGVVHTGVVSYINRKPKKDKLPFMVEVEITATSAGCGIYDPDGRFIGLLVNPLFRHGANFGTGAVIAPVDEITTFLDANDVPYQTVEKMRPPVLCGG